MSLKRFPRADHSGAEDIPIRTSTDEEADTIQDWMLLKEVDLR